MNSPSEHALKVISKQDLIWNLKSKPMRLLKSLMEVLHNTWYEFIKEIVIICGKKLLISVTICAFCDEINNYAELVERLLFLHELQI